MSSNTGKNIRAIRKALNLSVKKFAELTGVSKATIVNIEQGHTGLKVATIHKLISFTDFSFDEINSSSSFTISKTFKKELFEKHKNNLTTRQFFLVKPSILDAIDNELLSSDFFREFRETNEIVDFFENSGWEILGTSLQNELVKHPKVIWKKHPTKGNTYLYKKL